MMWFHDVRPFLVSVMMAAEKGANHGCSTLGDTVQYDGINAQSTFDRGKKEKGQNDSADTRNCPQGKKQDCASTLLPL